MWNIQKAPTVSIKSKLPALLSCALALFILASCAVKPHIGAVIVNNKLANRGVAIQRNGSTFLASQGTELKTGDIITTGNNQEAVLELENGAVEVTLFENSRITISSVILSLGDLAVKIKRKLKEAFQVETEFGNAASESTIYYVSVNQGSDIRVVGLEGRVRYSPPDNSPSVALDALDEAKWNGRSVIQSNLNRDQYNSLLRRINDVERAYKKGGGNYIVPNIASLPLKNAITILRNEGFTSIDSQPVLSNQKLGTVVSTTPASGQLAAANGSLIVAFAQQATTMPKLVGMFEAQALNTLSRARLRSGEISREITGSRRPGQIISQSSIAGRAVATGSTVDLTIEAESVLVPNVQGMRREIAIRTLEKYGLTVGKVSIEYGLDYQDDAVRTQSVYPNTRVAQGTEVDLQIDELGVRIPDFVGQDASKAVYELRRLGLKARFSQSRGRIIRQSIAAGSIVKSGSHIKLEVKYERIQ